MQPDVPHLDGVLTSHEVAETAASIAAMQEADGAIPWTVGEHVDVEHRRRLEDLRIWLEHHASTARLIGTGRSYSHLRDRNPSREGHFVSEAVAHDLHVETLAEGIDD